MSPRSRKSKRQLLSQSSVTMESTGIVTPAKRRILLGTVGFFFVATVITYSVVSSIEQKSMNKRSLRLQQNDHISQSLSSQHMEILQSEINEARFWNLLKPILIQRIPGSANISAVKKFIGNTLKNLGNWIVDYDSFYGKPPYPYKKIIFSNIIASTNPRASRKLVLACHYDSKILEGQYFEAAIDSAVPCAMLLELAHALRPLIMEHTRRQFQRDSGLDVSLDLIFFDGEEAFKQWTSTDSLYGSRHLASKWYNASRNPVTGIPLLDTIDLFVLLDLIGHEGTAFSNYTRTGTRWYDDMVNLERRLNRAGYITTNRFPIFRIYDRLRYNSIEDDHIPFIRLRNSLPVLHLISTPFPSEWHTVRDNEKLLSQSRSNAVLRIVTQFVAEYLHMIYPPK